MKQSILILSTFIAAPFLAVALSTTLLAETSVQGSTTDCGATLMSGSIAQLSATHAIVNTSVLIDATAADVWAALTDFDNMASWSSGTLQGMTGDVRDGGAVVISFIFGVDENGKSNSNQIPHTLIYEEGQKFGWSDSYSEDIGGGRDNHIYQVEACGDKTLFIQSDEVFGNPYAANFVTQLLPMYQTFNAELKAIVERGS